VLGVWGAEWERWPEKMPAGLHFKFQKGGKDLVSDEAVV
jgi:hypothetical protein